MRKFAILMLWLLGVSVVFWAGSMQDPAMDRITYIHITQSYPWEGVLFFGVVLSVEITILCLILRPRNYHRSWGRALAATFIFGGVSVFWAMGSVRQPVYYLFHVYWLFMVDLSLLALLFVSWISLSRSAARGRIPHRKMIRDYM